MKKIFNYKLLTVFTVLLFSSISCTKDFDEINTNNNRPTYDQAAPEMLLTNCIEVLTDRVHEIFLGEEMGSCWVQQQAKVQYTDEDRYRPRVSVINNTWASFYASSGMDAEAMINISKARGADYDNYQAAGIVLKCYVMSVLTDLFGDVPYTNAFKARPADGGILTPTYDTQASIYADLIQKLKDVNTLFDADKDFQGDILYNNDVDKWIKFANSLRIRLIMRQSDRVAPTAELTDMIVTHAADYPIFESNDDNAALAYLGSSPNNNPVHENRKTRDDHRVSKTIIDYMWTPSLKDWRMCTYAVPAEKQNDYVGLPNGLESAAAAAYLEGGLTHTSKLGTYFTAAEAPGQLMSYAELNFILSEATFKGLIPGAPHTAQEYYEEGVAASFTQFKDASTSRYSDYYVVNKVWNRYPDSQLNDWFGTITPTIDDLITDYLTNEQGAWVGTLEQILTQKWIAMFDQGLQSWFEWRRTGFPVLTPAANAYNPYIPQRVYYPSDEYSRNKANVTAAANSQGLVGQSDLNTRVWWDITDNH